MFLSLQVLSIPLWMPCRIFFGGFAYIASQIGIILKLVKSLVGFQSYLWKALKFSDYFLTDYVDIKTRVLKSDRMQNQNPSGFLFYQYLLDDGLQGLLDLLGLLFLELFFLRFWDFLLTHIHKWYDHMTDFQGEMMNGDNRSIHPHQSIIETIIISLSCKW